MTKRAKRKPTKPRARLLFKISPDSPEARDEGPRLLPIQEHKGEGQIINSRFLELADVALGPKRKT